MHLKVLLQSSGLTLAAVLSTAEARDVPIALDLCPTGVTLSVPDEFTMASGAEQEALRSAMLASVPAPQKKLSRYTEVLQINWQARSRPRIVVSVPNAMMFGFEQGTLTAQDWAGVRSLALGLRRDQMVELAEKVGQAKDIPNAGSNVAARLGEVSSDLADEILIFQRPTESQGGPPGRPLVASKIIYAQRCVVGIELSVDGADPRAQELLRELARHVTVR